MPSNQYPISGCVTGTDKCFENALSPRVQEYEFQIQTGPEHEHVGVQLDFCDGARWQGVTHGDEAHVLVTALVRRGGGRELLHFEVSRAMDHLSTLNGANEIPRRTYQGAKEKDDRKTPSSSKHEYERKFGIFCNKVNRRAMFPLC